jgi:glutamate dehydrogenase/leucine dehydrogenase
VAVCAEAALGGLDGRTAAVEGFGKVGGGVAREIARRGGRVVAVSTVVGCIAAPEGLDVEELWGLRREHGDRFVEHTTIPVRPPDALFATEADVLVPGARTGVIDGPRAASVPVGIVVPAANAPYTRDGIARLEGRGITALADFVCNAGAVIGYRADPNSTPAEVMDLVEWRLRELVEEAPSYMAGCRLAELFISTWRGLEHLPPGPPLA